MGNGMEALIMMALVVFMVTNLVSIAIAAWFIKVLAPIYKQMIKQMKRMYSELDEDEAE